MPNSRDKGARFERKLASMIREQGYNASRSAQHCGKTGDAPDVIGLPHIHVEAKHYANRAFDYEWLDQATRDSEGTGNIPAVFHKIDGREVVVTLRFEDFMKIYKEWEASKAIEARESRRGHVFWDFYECDGQMELEDLDDGK